MPGSDLALRAAGSDPSQRSHTEEPAIMMDMWNGLRGTHFAIEFIDDKVKTFSEAMH